MDLTLLDLKEAAARLRCKVHFVRTIIATGELPFVKIGKQFRVTVGDLDRWVERARGRPGEADQPRSTGKVRGKQLLRVAKSAS